MSFAGQWDTFYGNGSVELPLTGLFTEPLTRTPFVSNSSDVATSGNPFKRIY